MKLLQAAAEGGEGGMGSYGTLIMFALIFVVFYFFMIRPQQKKQKEAKTFRENLQKGDRIVTIGGVHGKVESVKDSTIVISTEDGGKLKVEKSAVASEFTEQGMAQQK